MKRLFSALLLPLTAAALTFSAAAAPQYILRSRDGMIAYYDVSARTWHETSCSAAGLSNAADRAALACGLPLETQTELTRALEDYCS